MTKQELGEKIKKARVKHGYTQQQLADLIGMTQAELSRIENGKRNCHLETIVHTLAAVGLQIKVTRK